MSRHGKNATAASVYSYHERKKDQKESGYGVLRKRLAAESIKEFDCCSLTLQPCRQAVVSPQGYIFDKEAILEYILQQKRENARKLKEWDKQRRKDETEAAELAKAERAAAVEQFASREATPAHPGSSNTDELENLKSEAKNPSVSNMIGSKATELPSFWIPSLQPSSANRIIGKPDQKVYCPMTAKQLKMKDLIPVIFTPIKDGDERTSTVAKKVRYMCPVTRDALTNGTPAAVLKTSGHVVTMECVERIVKKDWTDPTNGEPITEEEIIPLQRGGTGFSATNQDLEAKLSRPVLELQ